MTPNPVPSVKGQDEVFALSEGRTVWEGTLAPGTHEVATDGEDRRPVVLDEVVGEAKGEGNLWRAIWTGYIPLSFADLAPVNDLKSNLGITATITLRHQVAGIDQTAGGSQGEITQNASGAPSPELTPQKVSTASLRNQDLLQGLGGADPLPSVRLKYVQDCLFPTFSTVASANSISTKVTLDRPVRGMDDYASAAVLRKSFRCVLPIVSALQVRMRTLPAIPVEEHLDSGAGDVDVAIQQGNESDRGRTLICIEAELGAGTVGEELEYELSELEVLVGGKKRAVSLWAEMEGDGGQFPLTIRRSEQHNFVFKILPLVGQFDEGELGPERIRIEARGKVTESSPSTKAFQTDQFSAIWNSVVDMAALAIPQKTARFDHGLPSGDAMQPSSALPTTAMGSIHPGAFKNAERNTNPFGQADGGVGAELQRDLIISASIVPLGSEQEGEDARKSANDVKTFQSFMLEIIFLNLADEVLKLMVAVCLNQGSAAGMSYSSAMMAEGDADRFSLHSTGSSQTVIPLEADVRLTPLQPRACQVVRLRCMPIGTGILEVPAVEVHDLGRGLSARANFGLKVRAS